MRFFSGQFCYALFQSRKFCGTFFVSAIDFCRTPKNEFCIRPLKQMSILLECGIDHCAVWFHNSFLILDDLCGGSGRLVVVHQKNVLQHVGVIKGELCASSNQALQQRFAVC